MHTDGRIITYTVVLVIVKNMASFRDLELDWSMLRTGDRWTDEGIYFNVIFLYFHRSNPFVKKFYWVVEAKHYFRHLYRNCLLFLPKKGLVLSQ